MTQIISFDITGPFAAFKDPSVTTNQTCNYIPSKTAIVGILGAILGVKRDNQLGDIYSKEYLDFFKTTKIGISLKTENPNKVIFYSNHRSFKGNGRKTKPVKKEVLENPSYTIYAALEQHKDLMGRLKKNNFVFPPYLGHAYCPATITNPKQYDSTKSQKSSNETRCVVLDESEPFSTDFKFKCTEMDNGGSIMIERHLHHFFKDDVFQKKAIKHWIPMNCLVKVRDYDSKRQISEFYSLNDGEVVCLY